ncbi:hypothetical protein ABVT39_003545 [Epinephelus coioides]
MLRSKQQALKTICGNTKTMWTGFISPEVIQLSAEKHRPTELKPTVHETKSFQYNMNHLSVKSMKTKLQQDKPVK